MLCTLVCAALLSGPHANPLLPPLKVRLDSVCRTFHGRIGYCVKLLDAGDSIENRGTETFPTASTIKTAVALEAVREIDEGTLAWTDKRPVPPMDGRQYSMWAYFFQDGTTLDIDGWVNLMLTVSDNTALMVLREWMTPDKVNARLEGLGLRSTKVLWDNFPPDEPNKIALRHNWGLGMTTPVEMNRLLELLYRHKAASRAGCDRLLRVLGHQYWDDYAGVTSPIDVMVASKSGAIDRSRSEAAIVYSSRPYILTIYTDDQKDQTWTPTNEGDVTIRKMCGIIWNGLNPNRPYSPPAGYEKFLPTGGGVD